MNNLMKFDFEGQRLRTVVINEEYWFIGMDVANILGYANTKDALGTHIEEEDRRLILRSDIATLENHIPFKALPINFTTDEIPNRGLTGINESGLYALIFGSKLPRAKDFKHWVTSEVLPQLRKTGTYSMDNVANESKPNIDEFLISVTTALTEMSKVMSACVNAVCSSSTYKPEYDPNINYRKNQSICKIDTFPMELRNEVDVRITEMLNKSTLNLSYIARFCTARGYKISVPSVIKYFNRYFKK